jgi:hypothetical protein
MNVTKQKKRILKRILKRIIHELWARVLKQYRFKEPAERHKHEHSRPPGLDNTGVVSPTEQSVDGEVDRHYLYTCMD